MSEKDSELDQTKSKATDKQSKNEDEQIQNMSVGDIDPAILVVREKTKIKYSKDQLLEIGKNPASKRKPDFLDPAEVSVSILDPEKWNLERKKSDTPETNVKINDNDTRRRPADPRERIRKENDGIVLSPQRRSFNSGCFVPANKEPARSSRSHSPLGGKSESSHAMGVREIQSSSRRIGSGRIIRDSWDVGEKDANENEFSFSRGQSRGNERDERNESKYGERRSFGREIETGREKDKESRRNGRYSERRKYSDHKEDEPEWFSSGPLSQNDTIELRGFDDSEKIKKKSGGGAKRAKDWTRKKEPQQTIVEEDKTEESKESQQGNGENVKKEPEQVQAQSEPQAYADLFNFEEFLKCDTIPGLLTNGIGADTDKSTSRFSQWFKKDSPDQELMDSPHEDNHIIKDLLKDINESSSVPIAVHPPSDSSAYFAPISPAANTGGLSGLMASKPPQTSVIGQATNIVDMLMRGKQQQQAAQEGWNMKPQPRKILSLDELEAQIRPNPDHPATLPLKTQPQKPDEEMTAAFKRLLQQASGHAPAQNGPMRKPQTAMSLLEMLNHSQQQDRLAAAQVAATQQQQLLSALHAHQQQPQFPNDLTVKIQQAQLQKTMATGSTFNQMRVSPLLDLNAQQSRDLLNRPEAQAILQGLKRGEITTQHLYQQLANPALQPRHREMLVTILKLHGSYGPSPRALSPTPLTHHIYQQQQQQQQQQQLRVSPLPPNAMHQRIPSPRELQVHTQNILQRALIKKKLEEQSENYRKKQDMQRGVSPNPAASGSSTVSHQGGGGGTKGISSPTPLAFTPTSVLRKMTADKDEGKENKAVTDNGVKQQGRAVTGMRAQQQVNVSSQQWTQGFPIKQTGRPIVKANANYQSQTPDQFFSQGSQQQPQTQQRVYQSVSNQAQRKPIMGQQYPLQQGSQYGPAQTSYPHPNPQSFSQPQTQLTAQQLRAQHQHRPANNQASAQQQPKQVQPQQPMGFPHNHAQTQATASWQHFLNSAAHQQGVRQPPTAPSNSQQSGSPSAGDQLARWFSPDLLERARGGELPSTANLARHVLSLEDVERQAAAPPVHN